MRLRKTELAGEDVGLNLSSGAGGRGIRGAFDHCHSAWLRSGVSGRPGGSPGARVTGERGPLFLGNEERLPPARKEKTFVAVRKDIQFVGRSQLHCLDASFLWPLFPEHMRKTAGGELRRRVACCI